MKLNHILWLLAGVPGIIFTVVFAVVWAIAPRFGIILEPEIIAMYATLGWYGLMLVIAMGIISGGMPLY